MMDQLISRFTEQLEEALSIADNSELSISTKDINKVYVAGLGGSGIGGDFVREFIREESEIPYLGGKGYTIPNYIDKHTLAIVSSYSGNTEETVSQYDYLMRTGAQILVISSGGKLIEMAKSNNQDHILIPANWPSPRACLGYSVILQLGVLEKLGIIGEKALDDVRNSIRLLNTEESEIKSEAEKIASSLYQKIPIIYSTELNEAVGVRWRQQINENSKLLCWHHVIPEMNHNELVGWKDKNEDFVVVYLRNDDDHDRSVKRIEINQEIIQPLCGQILEVHSKGKSLIEKSLYLVHLGDWVSWYLAELRGVDAIEVNVIDYLKSELAKFH